MKSLVVVFLCAALSFSAEIQYDEHLKAANNYLAAAQNVNGKRLMSIYDASMDELEKSINKYNNPLAANQFRYLSKVVYGQTLKKDKKKTLEKAIEILIGKRDCEAFLDYGELREKNKDITGAIAAYSDGIKFCQDKKYLNILEPRLEKLKKYGLHGSN